MSKVIVRNGNVDGALRTMKQKNARDGLLKKVREKQEGYKKPGVKRREKKEQGIKNIIDESNNVTDIEGIKKYNCLGYKFNSELSLFSSFILKILLFFL